MEWYWILITIVVSFFVGWSCCAFMASGKIADLEMDVIMERQHKETWKAKTWKLINERIQGEKS